jgi:hypothetical protein
MKLQICLALVASIISPACAVVNALPDIGKYTKTGGMLQHHLNDLNCTADCAPETDTDFNGGDMFDGCGNLMVLGCRKGHQLHGAGCTWDRCCRGCRAYGGCKAWTWSPNDGGSCFLKSGKVTVAQSSGSISGYPLP